MSYIVSFSHLNQTLEIIKLLEQEKNDNKNDSKNYTTKTFNLKDKISLTEGARMTDVYFKLFNLSSSLSSSSSPSELHYLLEVREYSKYDDAAIVNWYSLTVAINNDCDDYNNGDSAKLIVQKIDCSLMLAIQERQRHVVNNGGGTRDDRDNKVVEYFSCMDTTIAPNKEKQLFYLVQFVQKAGNSSVTIESKIVKSFSSFNNLFPFYPSHLLPNVCASQTTHVNRHAERKDDKQLLHFCDKPPCCCRILVNNLDKNEDKDKNEEKDEDSSEISAASNCKYIYFHNASGGSQLSNMTTGRVESFKQCNVFCSGQNIYFHKTDPENVYNDNRFVTRICFTSCTLNNDDDFDVNNTKYEQKITLPECFANCRFYLKEARDELLIVVIHQQIPENTFQELETVVKINFFLSTFSIVKPTTIIKKLYYTNYYPYSYVIDTRQHEEEFFKETRNILSNYLLPELIYLIRLF